MRRFLHNTLTVCVIMTPAFLALGGAMHAEYERRNEEIRFELNRIATENIRRASLERVRSQLPETVKAVPAPAWDPAE